MLGFKPGRGSHLACLFGNTHLFGDHVALGYSLLPHGLGSRRDFVWKEGGEKTLAGLEKVP